ASIGTSIDGKLATATFRWMPAEPGDYSIGFVAKNGGAKAPVRTYLIHVAPKYPYAYRLSDDKVGYWAGVLQPAVVHKTPSKTAPAVTKLELRTEDANTHNIVLVLEALEKKPGDMWYRVRLPILPNNTTGWVQKSALGDLYKVDTHVYVDLKKLTI